MDHLNYAHEYRTAICREGLAGRWIGRLRHACLALAAVGLSAGLASGQLTIEIKDYLTMPITGSVDSGKEQNAGLLARVNFLREEPGGAKRLFINDLNGPLYILDKETKKLTTYLNFNGMPGQPGLFHKFTIERGLGNGFINFLFDPDYAHNGRFYTIHVEDVELPGSSLPDNKNFPGFKTAGYTLSSPIKMPGPFTREIVVIEWTDTNTSNTTFEGTARELMRVQYNSYMHPMGEFIFNPTARPGDADWRVLYFGCGDAGSGEARDPKLRMNPQRLDALEGKILRIIPDLKEHVDSSTVSDNGRYRIPNDNPFVQIPGAHGEIWALGLRNPNRLSWDVEPGNPSNNHLFASVVGLRTWETVEIIHKGANYGYSLREGNEQLNANNSTGPLPAVDKIPLQVNETTTEGTVVPTYPVIQYAHTKDGGDAMSSGFVYRGKAFPALRGKFIFGDITTGRIWYAELKDMLAADDGDPKTMAPIHEVKILWDRPQGGKELYNSMSPITEAGYHSRGGKSEHLPGFARVAGSRADIRFCVDGQGELYILSKSDGMIRAVVGGTGN